MKIDSLTSNTVMYSNKGDKMYNLYISLSLRSGPVFSNCAIMEVLEIIVPILQEQYNAWCMTAISSF